MNVYNYVGILTLQCGPRPFALHVYIIYGVLHNDTALQLCYHINV